MLIFPKGFLKKVELLARGQSITFEVDDSKYGLTRTNIRNQALGHNYFVQRYHSGIYSSYIDVVNPFTIQRAIDEITIREIHDA